jgi:hypothetical protein
LPWGVLWFVSRGLKVGLFCGLLLAGSVVRLLLLVYSVCNRGTLRCFFNKIAITYIKKKKKKDSCWDFESCAIDVLILLLGVSNESMLSFKVVFSFQFFL